MARTSLGDQAAEIPFVIPVESAVATVITFVDSAGDPLDQSGSSWVVEVFATSDPSAALLSIAPTVSVGTFTLSASEAAVTAALGSRGQLRWRLRNTSISQDVLAGDVVRTSRGYGAKVGAGTGVTVQVTDTAVTVQGPAATVVAASDVDLSYTASPTGGTVSPSGAGDDAALTLADGTNAGLMAPAQHTKLAGIAAGATDDTAADAAQGDIDAHVGDAAGAHAATAISFAPASGIAATDVQAAIVEAKTDAQTYADSAVSTHSSDTTSVHGIADTSALETTTGAQSKADAAQSAAESTAAGALSSHVAAGDPHPGYLTEAAAATTYQPLDSDLTAVAALTTTSFGRALLELANAGAARTTLGLAIGTDVQAHSAVLDATTASFTTADESKLDNIEAGAEVNTVDSVNSQTGAVVLDADDIDDTTTAHRFATAAQLSAVDSLAATYQPLDSDLTAIAALATTTFGRSLLALADDAALRTAINVEDGADVTDTTNVEAAGALMDSEVDADLKTLSLPANTTISTFGASLVDDADAGTARTTLGAEAAGAAAAAQAAAVQRANHTGTQAASTISDFSTAADARIAAASVGDLDDVTITTPSTGEVLKWSGTAWVNDTDATGGGGGDLADLTDVTVTSVADNEVLAYDSGTSTWINQTPAEAGLQAADAELAAIAGLTSAADRVPYFTGSGTASLATFTAAGRALVDDADAAAQRTTLGLGTIATQAANNVAITGGSVSGITDLAIADGGTGASTAAAARDNLGVNVTEATLIAAGWHDVTFAAYGATGDGTTNDTAAIQAAIDAAEANDGTVFFPAGKTYSITSLTIDSHPVRVQAYGATFVARSAAAMLTITGAGADGVLWEGGFFDGATKTATVGIDIVDTDAAVVRDVRVDDCVVGVRFHNALDADGWVERCGLENVAVWTCTVGIDYLLGETNPSFNECWLTNVFVSACTTGIRQGAGSDFKRVVWTNVVVWVPDAGVGLLLDGEYDQFKCQMGFEGLSGTTVGVELGTNFTADTNGDDHRIEFDFISITTNVDNNATGSTIAWRRGNLYYSTPGRAHLRGYRDGDTHTRWEFSDAGIKVGNGTGTTHHTLGTNGVFTVNSILELTERAAPGTPSSGLARMYANTDGTIGVVRDTGVVDQLAVQTETWTWRAVDTKTAAYTLVLGDAGKLIEMDGDFDFTIPNNADVAFPVGTQVGLLLADGHTGNVVDASSVQLNGETAGAGSLAMTPHQIVVCTKLATDRWNVSGV